jgi:hypothetical protein
MKGFTIILTIAFSILFLSTKINTSDALRSLLPSTAGKCGIINPTVSTDCTSKNIRENYCCFMTPSDGGASFCNWISPPAYLPSMETYNLEGVDYTIDCGIVEGKQGTPCGILNPKELKDCSASSTENNSCCIYHLDDLKYCFWLGYSGKGQVITTVTCNSTFLSSFVIILSIFISMVIL